MNKIQLLFFATLRDFMGTRSLSLDIPSETTVAGLKLLLAAQYAKAGPTLETALVSINKEFAFEADVIPPGAEVALFPPVSGG